MAKQKIENVEERIIKVKFLKLATGDYGYFPENSIQELNEKLAKSFIDEKAAIEVE